MHQYDTKPEDLGKIAIAQREHAMKNPNAYLKTPLYHGAVSVVENDRRLRSACLTRAFR